MTHSSQVRIDAVSMTEEARKNYQLVAAAIREFGTPNKQFPKDKDIEFGTLRQHLEGKLAGLGTILKNMKQQKMVDYADPFIKDGTIITLVEDYYQQAIPQMITYEEICQKIKGEEGPHVKTNY